ncbi:MAG: viperin family antiviral radical SAM protein [Bacteroidota bacterium]
MKRLTLNFHFWRPCNYTCKFCYAGFEDTKSALPKGHLPQADGEQIIRLAADFGFYKINFVGGEPTLCPWLGDYLKLAKQLGLRTSIVTNGSRMTPEYTNAILPCLDQVGLSLDSLDPDINRSIGRVGKGKAPQLQPAFFLRLANQIRQHGVHLKINTVVCRDNVDDTSLRAFVDKVQPDRWKRFQVLRIEEENGHNFDDYAITKAEYQIWLERNQPTNPYTICVDEDNDLMRGSYVMMNPEGRLFSNTNADVGADYNHSAPVLEVGFANAMQQIDFRADRYVARGGDYSLEDDANAFVEPEASVSEVMQ